MVYGFITETVKIYHQGDVHKAITRIEEAGHQIPNYSHTISHYYVGKMYESVGDEDKAKTAFADHRIHGSIFGETVIRLEDEYLDVMSMAANNHELNMIDSSQSIIGDIPYLQPNDILIKYYIDDCHFSPAGHKEIAASLAQSILTSKQPK
jgi:lysophospholipase L1-like esterase